MSDLVHPGDDQTVGFALEGRDDLSLKWGTMKGWNLKSDAARKAARKYLAAGPQSMGAMSQHDSEAQKQALCELIDAIDGRIINDWSGEVLSKGEAKAYVRSYNG